MSSRILTREAACDAAAIVWRKLGPEETRCQPLMAGESALHTPPETSETQALLARIQQLESELVMRERQAREMGLREGEVAAEKRLAAPLKEALMRLASHIDELAGVRRLLRREAEEDLVKLAIAIARRVIRRELTTDPEAILGLVKAAFEKVDAREVFRVRVHPADAALLETALRERAAPDRVEIVADRSLERGAVILETARGNLDASAETQLIEIERGLADLVRRRA
jgi:flagellar assembly protein FliH